MTLSWSTQSTRSRTGRRAVGALLAVTVLGGVGIGVVAARSNVPNPSAQVVWPFVDFQTVPKLGGENVRGSGCGGTKSIGNQIPDGVWSGQIDALVDGNGAGTNDIGAAVRLNFDLWCVYQGAAAKQAKANTPAQRVVLDNPAYFVVNSNEKVRSVPLSENFLVRYAVRLVDGRCIDPGPAELDVTTQDGRPYFRVAQSWLRIENGEAQWAFVDCHE